MKTLLVGALLMLGGCSLAWFGARPSPVEIPKESVRKEVIARFQQDKLPEPKQLFVCARVPVPDGVSTTGSAGNEEEFWCIDYFLFQAKLRESEKQGVTEL